MRLFRWLWKGEEVFLMGSMAFMATLTFVAVLSRYSFGYPIPWSEELTRYLFMWMCMVGTSVGIRRGAHIGIDILTNRLPEKFKKPVGLIGMLIAVGFCVILAYIGSLQMIAQSNQLSAAMDLNMGIVYASIPVGACLMTISLLATFAKTQGMPASTECQGPKEG